MKRIPYNSSSVKKNEKYQKVKVPHIHRRGYILVEKTGEPTTADEHNEKWLNEKEAKS